MNTTIIITSKVFLASNVVGLQCDLNMKSATADRKESRCLCKRQFHRNGRFLDGRFSRTPEKVFPLKYSTDDAKWSVVFCDIFIEFGKWIYIFRQAWRGKKINIFINISNIQKLIHMNDSFKLNLT